MKIKYSLTIAMISVLMIASAVSAFPTEDRACNFCHVYPPTQVNVTTSENTIMVSPGATFTLTIDWNGGGTKGTAVKWPSDFSVIGLTRDNTLFNPNPVLPANGAATSGTTSSMLTAPAAVGNYMVRVYAATAGPWETDFKDIAVEVATPTPTPTTPTPTVTTPIPTTPGPIPELPGPSMLVLSIAGIMLVVLMLLVQNKKGK